MSERVVSNSCGVVLVWLVSGCELSVGVVRGECWVSVGACSGLEEWSVVSESASSKTNAQMVIWGRFQTSLSITGAYAERVSSTVEIHCWGALKATKSQSSLAMWWSGSPRRVSSASITSGLSWVVVSGETGITARRAEPSPVAWSWSTTAVRCRQSVEMCSSLCGAIASVTPRESASERRTGVL